MNTDIKEIAQRVKELREVSDVSLEDAANKIGIEPKTLALYESGMTDIPMGFLLDLAKMFGVELTDILSGGLPQLGTFSFVKKDHGIAVERRSHYKYQHLAANFSHKLAEPFMVTVESNDDEIHLNSHDGQEFNYCVEGKLMIIISGQEVIMEPGDSLYFNSATPHGMKALDGKPAKFLAIIFNK